MFTGAGQGVLDIHIPYVVVFRRAGKPFEEIGDIILGKAWWAQIHVGNSDHAGGFENGIIFPHGARAHTLQWAGL